MVLVYQSMEMNTGISKYGIVKNNVDNFNFTLNLNFSSIMSSLLEKKQLNSCKISTIPPKKSADISVFSNSSQPVCPEIDKGILDSQDCELLSISEELKISDHNLPLERSVNISATRIKCHFCSNTVFNVSNRILTDIEIKVLEKGLGFAPILRKINEPELRQDFAEFCRQRTRSGYSEKNVHHSFIVKNKNFTKNPLFI